MNYGQNCGQAIPQVPKDLPRDLASPASSGLHDGLLYMLRRLVGISQLLDATLQKIHGPRPMATPEVQKDNGQQPSVIAIGGYIQAEIDRLNKHAEELASFIG